jgi:SAM-dependent methyltransferase
MPDVSKYFRTFSPLAKFCRQFEPSARVLDLGCGTGQNGRFVREILPAIEFYGVDMIPPESVPEFYRYSFVDIDNDDLPYPDQTFDAVVFTHVIEHLAHPFRVAGEIGRVLKKGGMVYVETPNWTSALVPSFGFRREQLQPFNFYDDPTHSKPWSKQGLFVFLYQGCGLHVVKVASVRNFVKLPFDLGKIVFGIFSGRRAPVVYSFWNLFGWCIYGVARKD